MTSDRTGASAKEKLLDRCVEFLARNGFGNLSLREIAAGVGTSHRMLIYHFGGHDELLAEVVGRVEAQTRASLVALAGQVADPVELGRVFWRSLADPALAPAERLFFEIYANALYGRPWTQSLRASVIEAWTGPVEEMFRSLGFAPDEAAVRTRIALALTRGLLLDLLLTGDRPVLDEAAELFGQLLVHKIPRPG
jgi:AcrR family transcriptional regulator